MAVRCGDAEPFRVELGYPGFHEDFKGPGRGETVQMKADVKPKDAKWDLSDPALSWKADRNRPGSRSWCAAGSGWTTPLAGLDLLLHRIGWSVQVPARQAAERDEAAIAAWREETWPVVKARRRT